MEEKNTVRDVAGEGGFVSMNFTKLHKVIKECKEKGRDAVCRVHLKDLGIEWVD